MFSDFPLLCISYHIGAYPSFDEIARLSLVHMVTLFMMIDVDLIVWFHYDSLVEFLPSH